MITLGTRFFKEGDEDAIANAARASYGEVDTVMLQSIMSNIYDKSMLGRSGFQRLKSFCSSSTSLEYIDRSKMTRSKVKVVDVMRGGLHEDEASVIDPGWNAVCKPHPSEVYVPRSKSRIALAHQIRPLPQGLMLVLDLVALSGGVVRRQFLLPLILLIFLQILQQ